MCHFSQSGFFVLLINCLKDYCNISVLFLFQLTFFLLCLAATAYGQGATSVETEDDNNANPPQPTLYNPPIQTFRVSHSVLLTIKKFATFDENLINRG